MRWWSIFLSLGLLAGCQSYEIVQRNVFADDDGNAVYVDYGRSEREHVNQFISPVTGKEMDFKSKLVVEVTLPDGEDFTAWQCMNFMTYGTMYRTDNEKWMMLANGFTCIVYRRQENDKTKYDEVFRGVLCDTPGEKAEKDERWKDVGRKESGYRKYEQSSGNKVFRK